MNLIEDEASEGCRSTLEMKEGAVVCYGLDPVIWLKLDGSQYNCDQHKPLRRAQWYPGR